MTSKGQTCSPEVLQVLGGILMNAASGNIHNNLSGCLSRPATLKVDSNEYKSLLNMPLWQLTGEQYKNLTTGIMLDVLTSIENQKPQRHLIYGIDGLAEYLGVSRSTAQRIKRSGIIDDAIAQRGRTIVIDGDLAIQLMKVNEGQKGGRR